MTMKIDSLPDYPALQQLARALWRDGTVRGAAVFVGAGFSKNAILPAKDTQQPPLWRDLCDAMVKQLYPGSKYNIPTDPLRIAEEYRIYFGQASLDDFIRSHFPDRSWQPGLLHKKLLEFPWSDVLTTNWDTLLERASENVSDQQYDLVRLEVDLPHARAPRVIKLHGSLGDEGPLIFAEEDYRSYPIKHAAFVNLARQVFIENELCLIGFSGDDPNFLEWTGWVRDQLGDKARRIYLVGNLGLAPAKRKFLESRNIAPIDFAPLLVATPKSEHHAEATRLFFSALHDARPTPLHNWTPLGSSHSPLVQAGADAHSRALKDDPYAAKLLQETATLLQKKRETYPGWLVCPAHLRSWHGQSDEAWLLRPSVLEVFEQPERAAILREFLWQSTVSYSKISNQQFLSITDFLEGDTIKVDTDVLCEFSIALMRRARMVQNEKDLLKWDHYVEQLTLPQDEFRMAAKYQICLFHRDQLKYQALSESLSFLESTDPIWMLRHAGLLTEVGLHTQATKLIREAAAELERRYRLDNTSIWIKSRFGWAEWIARWIDARLSRTRVEAKKVPEFKELQVDPNGEIEQIETSAVKLYEKHQMDDARDQPLFDPGHYREAEPQTQDSVDSSAMAMFYQLDQIMEFVGLPIRTSSVSFCADAVRAVAKVTYRRTVEWYFWLIRGLGSHHDKEFDIYFSRIAVAQLTNEVSSELISVVRAGVDFWISRIETSNGSELLDDMRGASYRLRLYLWILSRLTVRMTNDDAQATFFDALNLSKRESIRHYLTLEAINELANQSIASLPAAIQGKLALDVIEFPLPKESQSDARWWPDVLNRIWDSVPSRAENGVRWRQRIQQLLEVAQSGQPSRKEAVHRLSYLSLRGSLESDENSSFADALWSEIDSQNGLPANTGLLSSALADLPAPNDIDPKALVCSMLFQSDKTIDLDASKPLDTRVLNQQLANIQSYVLAAQIGLTPTPEQARILFDAFIKFESTSASTDSMGDSWRKGYLDEMRRHVGTVLANLCVPALSSEEKNVERASALRTWILDSREWYGLPGLPEFLKTMPHLADDLTTLIRRALVSSFSHRVGSGVTALRKWAALVPSGLVVALPESLVNQLISTIETRHEHGLQALLYTARYLLERDFIPPEGVSRLLYALGELWLETKYIDTEAISRKAISLSLVRAECSRLAFAMKSRIRDDGTLAQWIETSKSDPLPEVRNALVDG